MPSSKLNRPKESNFLRLLMTTYKAIVRRMTLTLKRTVNSKENIIIN
jgi:hypothetical protein